MKNYNAIDAIANALLIIGGLNWGSIGLLDFDPIDTIFGDSIAQAIFVIVGIAAIYKLGVWVVSKTN